VHDDFTTVRVTIEEADPSNPELCEYMYEAMVTRFPSVAFCISPEW
jgi:hypothetical protein